MALINTEAIGNDTKYNAQTILNRLLSGALATFREAAVESTPGDTFTDHIEATEFLRGLFFLEVSAQSGTNPTLDIALQVSPNGTDWFDSDAFAQVGATTGKYLLKSTQLGRYLRFKLTLGGTTPSYTLTLKGHFKGV